MHRKLPHSVEFWYWGELLTLFCSQRNHLYHRGLTQLTPKGVAALTLNHSMGLFLWNEGTLREMSPFFRAGGGSSLDGLNLVLGLQSVQQTFRKSVLCPRRGWGRNSLGSHTQFIFSVPFAVGWDAFPVFPWLCLAQLSKEEGRRHGGLTWNLSSWVRLHPKVSLAGLSTTSNRQAWPSPGLLPFWKNKGAKVDFLEGPSQL